MKKTNKKGFTIVELVIVIAVIAILSAVLIPTFSNVTNKAKESAALQEARAALTNVIAEEGEAYGGDYYIVVDDYCFFVDGGQFQKDKVTEPTDLDDTTKYEAIDSSDISDLGDVVVYKVIPAANA